jgi:hypothetical protein
MLNTQQKELGVLENLNITGIDQLSTLQTSNDKLIQQTKYLEAQLEILSSNQKELNMNKRIEKKANVNRFINTLGIINEMYRHSGFEAPDSDFKTQFVILNKFHQLVQSEMTNPFVLSSDTLNEKWSNLNLKIESAMLFNTAWGGVDSANYDYVKTHPDQRKNFFAGHDFSTQRRLQLFNQVKESYFDFTNFIINYLKKETKYYTWF